jgi:hypothetical protein
MPSLPPATLSEHRLVSFVVLLLATISDSSKQIFLSGGHFI